MNKKVSYKGEYLSNVFDILCWEGTSLSAVWNSIKSFYTTGAMVTLMDNHGNVKTFVKGLI